MQNYWDYVEELEGTLKPCPFCKNEDMMLTGGFKVAFLDKEHFVAECSECGCSTRYCESPEEAVELWNTRA